ncbi:acetylxylan esterase [Alkalihalobacillus sp. 1P02AB]|uniref:acetylxylan esterase n=1 Tax=Alkalihalobacillus sp. 1P02AB TaxID=3132260 RepID=UPI0039A5D25B
MKYLKETIEQLEMYEPILTKQANHDLFWTDTIRDAHLKPLNETLQEVDYPIKQIKAYEVSYQGFDETPLQAFYIVPEEHEGSLPCLVIFHGYGGHKNSISHYMKWLIQGYAVLAVDCRGQGRSGDFSGYTSDELGSWVVKGILDKKDYYYRKVYVDAIRAIDFVCTRTEVDQERIGVMGASMGGGITLAVAALDDRPKLAVADVPNMCDIELAMKQKFEGSLTIVEQFLHRHPEYVETVYKNLTYFDNLNLCEQITCRTRISVGLKDLICPPMPIYGVYNRINAEKSIEVYPFSGHDMAIIEHMDKTLLYVKQYL